MVKKQKTLSVCICLILLFINPFVCAAEAPLKHIVFALNAKDVMVGFGDGYMGWDETLTRAQAVKIIVAAMGFTGKVIESVTLSPTFPDVDRLHWAFRFVNFACEFGIIKGFPDGTFRPEKQVTRAEYLVMLCRMYTALGGALGAAADLVLEPDWMAQEVLKVPDLLDVMQPRQGESFHSNMLRSEAGSLTYGLMERFGLAYDFIGTITSVSPNKIGVRLQGSSETVSIGLTSETICVYDGTEASLNDKMNDKTACIVLDRSKACAFVWVQ